MKATVFYFDSFSLDISSGKIEYIYSTDVGHSFVHTLTFSFPEGSQPETLIPAVFALGMAELPHYWKAILAPKIIVRAGSLSISQIDFWKNLYTKGLGEFFYINKIDFKNLVNIESTPEAPEIQACTTPVLPTALVSFGGGKDALVSAELLKAQHKAFSWFELEPLTFAPDVQRVSGVVTSIQMGRNVSKNFAPIKKLVAQGAPNGHVPITATYIFSAVLSATAYGFRDVIMSLERSANEGNVEYLGEKINHQYSKSFEFEKMVSEYVHTYVNPSIRVFSLLRPLYEIQIIREFVKYPAYFPYFISCNRGLKTGTWCGVCAKCAFMFAGLSAFLPVTSVERIFGKNLFEDTNLIQLYRDLIGLGTMKPFDCVGTFEENLLALYLAGEQYKKENKPLPYILSELPIEKGQMFESLLNATTHEHLIPEDYQTL